jgi:uncharacterized protein YjcR
VPKERDPRRDQAFEVFIQSKGSIKLKDIARLLSVAEGTIRGWKNKDSWAAKLNGTFQTKIRNVPNKKGGQPGNSNAKGHGAPKKNTNSLKHGFFSKFLPPETLEIMEQMNERSPADLIWDQIQIQYAAIIRAQQIMYVKSKEDLTKVLKRTKEGYSQSGSSSEEEYEIQFAWDKQASFLNAQSRAMSELRSLIKQFDEMANTNDERRLKLEQMKLGIEKTKAEIIKLRGEDNEEYENDGFIEALNGKVEEIWSDDGEQDET